MRVRICLIYLLLCCTFPTLGCAAETSLYQPGKVVYDVSSSDRSYISRLLDRANILQGLYNHDVFSTSIVFVVHEDAIPFFSNGKKNANLELLQRASNLALGEIIQFKVCRLSANMQGFHRDDFDEFIKLVPMADAEIAQLQHNGYAYLK